MILAGDVGATKILLEVGDPRSERWKPVLARRYVVDDFPDISAVMARFLEEWEAVRPPRARITAGALGAAGPVQDNRIKMTNRPWILDGDILARRCGLDRLLIVNDLYATARGIGALAARDFITLQPGKAAAESPRVVLGIGTGLGVAHLLGKPGTDPAFRAKARSRGQRKAGSVPGSPPPVILPGEGGHVGFSPASAAQAHLWQWLFAARGRVEGEDIASGGGLANIYEFLRSQEPRAGNRDRADPEWISDHAINGTDATCASAFALFTECLGNIAGDHALAMIARGGVYLAGGVTARIAPALDKARFRAAFCAKGVFASLLMNIPVRAVLNARTGILGAAAIAADA